MIHIKRHNTPDALDLQNSNSVGAKEFTDAILYFKDNDRKFPFEAYKKVKGALNTMFNGKCAFCESDIKPVTYGDIEHFRPKAAYHASSNEALNYPGYYWLAMDWNNLLLSCDKCNRTYKKNQFPLVNEENRKKKHNHQVSEEPLLIDPCDENINPQKHIYFTEEGIVKYILGDGGKGKKSIEVYGLSNPELTRKRKKLAKEIVDKKTQILNYLDNIKILLGTSQTYPEGFKVILENNFRDLETVYNSLKRLNLPTEPYQGMVRNLTSDFLLNYSPKIDELLSEFHKQKI